VKNRRKRISTEDKLDWIKPTRRRWTQCWHISQCYIQSHLHMYNSW